ncbi:hypothetical protein SacglDRAFT_03394 [Saccharomonospora glauca K62]|jgi:hypothetical protein|uniref:Uncharacterized protein n=1 Tax=Saccharomonospora glauca K62 TaxID=928724 RepID=I1D5N0_9PSEU|nr:hypothetical protein SacglDRAFT_03394 [Saccharomonospora glauca K62]
MQFMVMHATSAGDLLTGLLAHLAHLIGWLV